MYTSLWVKAFTFQKVKCNVISNAWQEIRTFLSWFWTVLSLVGFQSKHPEPNRDLGLLSDLIFRKSHPGRCVNNPLH